MSWWVLWDKWRLYEKLKHIFTSSEFRIDPL
jgi:hypothetical protein